MYSAETLKYLARLKEALEAIPASEIPDEAIVDLRVRWYGGQVARLYEEGWEFTPPEPEEMDDDYDYDYCEQCNDYHDYGEED